MGHERIVARDMIQPPDFAANETPDCEPQCLVHIPGVKRQSQNVGPDGLCWDKAQTARCRPVLYRGQRGKRAEAPFIFLAKP